MDISEITHHDLPRLTKAQKLLLCKHYKVMLHELPGHLAYRTRNKRIRLAAQKRALLADPPQPDAHIYRCTCGSWTTGHCTVCRIVKNKGAA